MAIAFEGSIFVFGGAILVQGSMVSVVALVWGFPAQEWISTLSHGSTEAEHVETIV